MTSGRPVASHAPAHFASTVSSQRQVGKQQQIERAVVAVVAEQAVEVEQRRQQRADPQHRRADAREELQVRADAERHDVTTARKNTSPTNAPPLAERQARGLPGDGGERRDHASPSARVAVARDGKIAMGGDDRHAARLRGVRR